MSQSTAEFGELESVIVVDPEATSSTFRSAPENGGEGLLAIYLEDIGQYPLLTKEEEVALAQAIEVGVAAQERLDEAGQYANLPRHRDDIVLRKTAEQARKRFIQSNLRLVVSIAKKYQGRGADIMDLIQLGNLGLEHAVGKFEWEKGFKFSTYATWWIRQSISRGINETANSMRLPVKINEDITALLKAETEIGLMHLPVTTENLAEQLGWDDKKVNKVQLWRTREVVASLDKPISRDGHPTPLGDLVGDPKALDSFDAVERAELPEQLRKALQEMPKQYREVLVVYYGLDDGEPKSLERTGEILGMEHGRARVLKEAALDMFRHPSMVQITGDLALYFS